MTQMNTNGHYSMTQMNTNRHKGGAWPLRLTGAGWVRFRFTALFGIALGVRVNRHETGVGLKAFCPSRLHLDIGLQTNPGLSQTIYPRLLGKGEIGSFRDAGAGCHSAASHLVSGLRFLLASGPWSLVSAFLLTSGFCSLISAWPLTSGPWSPVSAFLLASGPWSLVSGLLPASGFCSLVSAWPLASGIWTLSC